MASTKRQFLLLLRVLWDFMKGMYAFHFVGACVTTFGSARLKPESHEYRMAHQLGMGLGRGGFTIMTGGGPGLMEATSRGVHEAGGRCVGCRISLSFPQSTSGHLDRWVTFRYFFVRKVMLFRHSCAFIALPGGLGTLDELFEVLTLIQTKKIQPLPIVFFGTAYWQPVLSLLETMVSAGTITLSEMELVMSKVLVTDDVDEAIAHIKEHIVPLSRRQGRRPPVMPRESSRRSESASAAN